jgi:hypothetical protein
VAKRAGDHLPRTRLNLWRWFNRQHFGWSLRAEFGQIELDGAADSGLPLRDPGEWPQQLDGQFAAVRLGHRQPEQTPSGLVRLWQREVDLVAERVSAPCPLADADRFDWLLIEFNRSLCRHECRIDRS